MAPPRQVHHRRHVPEHPLGARWKYTPPPLAAPRPIAAVERAASALFLTTCASAASMIACGVWLCSRRHCASSSLAPGARPASIPPESSASAPPAAAASDGPYTLARRWPCSPMRLAGRKYTSRTLGLPAHARSAHRLVRLQ